MNKNYLFPSRTSRSSPEYIKEGITYFKHIQNFADVTWNSTINHTKAVTSDFCATLYIGTTYATLLTKKSYYICGIDWKLLAVY